MKLFNNQKGSACSQAAEMAMSAANNSEGKQ